MVMNTGVEITDIDWENRDAQRLERYFKGRFDALESENQHLVEDEQQSKQMYSDSQDKNTRILAEFIKVIKAAEMDAVMDIPKTDGGVGGDTDYGTSMNDVQ